MKNGYVDKLSLKDMLVGRDATDTQQILVFGVALAAGFALGAWAYASGGFSTWKVLCVGVLAFDVFGGAVACSLAPLQNAHTQRYTSPQKQLTFMLGHVFHLLMVFWLLSEVHSKATFAAIALLAAGALVCALAPSTLRRGAQAAAFLTSATTSLALLSNSVLQSVLLMALFFKLFVAFPSFESRRQEANITEQ